MGRVKAASNPYRQGDTIYWSKPRYDELGRAVESFAPAENGQTGASLGITEYGISTMPGFVGATVTTTDAAGKKGRSFTNALGQLTRVDEPNYEGDLTAVPQSSPNPSPTPNPTPGEPPFDPPCSVECLTGGTYPSYSTYYKYNAQGKMVEVVQGEQHRYFKYDSLGRLIRVRQPEQQVNNNLDLPDSFNTSGKWTAEFTYDVKGNVSTATDANGTIISYTYDKANRVTTRTYSNEPNGMTTPAVTYYYDGLGLSGSVAPREGSVNLQFAKGKLTKVTSSVSETRYTQFDYLGRLLQSEQRTPLNGETIATADPKVSSYKYNFSGALIKQTYPSNRVIENAFESDGDLSRIYGKATANAIERTYANSFSYTPDGRIEKIRLGNHRWEWATFNDRLQVTELNLGSGINDASLWKLKYDYGEIDANGNVDVNKNTGNIARMTTSFNGLAHPFIQSFKYDSLYRLTEARETSNSQQTWKQNFSYDRYGNRINYENFIGTNQQTLDNKTHPSIDPQTNRFNTDQGYHYDFNGNLTQDAEGRSFTFNGNNKQVEIKKSNGDPVSRYFYDGEGKRVKKVTNSETVIFVYDGLGKIVAEYSTKQSPTNPTTSFTATDTLSSPRVITDSNGSVISRRDFQPFGEEILTDGARRTSALKYGSADSIRQKFTSYQRDEETLLDFAEARMYENRHARFTAVDPLLASGKSANPQTFNRYIYVMNNPLVLTDPSGLQASQKTTVTPCQQGEQCPYLISPDQKSVTDTIPNTVDVLGIEQPTSPIQKESAMLATTLVLQRLMPLAGAGAGAASTTGGVAAAPACAAATTIFCGYLLGQRISQYNPGGFYDNTVNRYSVVNGVPQISMIGSTNVLPRDFYYFSKPKENNSTQSIPRIIPFPLTPGRPQFNLALGLTPHVFDLAARTGSLTYAQAAPETLGVFQTAAFMRVANEAKVINFTLKGFTQESFNNFFKDPNNLTEITRESKS